MNGLSSRRMFARVRTTEQLLESQKICKRVSGRSQAENARCRQSLTLGVISADGWSSRLSCAERDGSEGALLAIFALKNKWLETGQNSWDSPCRRG